MGKVSKLVLFGLTIVIIASSCAKKENVPATPVLTFNSFSQYLNIAAGQDSAIMEVNFTDGNGDVGYIGDPQPNFFIKMYWDSSQHLVLFNPGSSDSVFSYKIPNLTPSGNNKGLTGIIKINMNPYIFPTSIVNFVQGDTILFDVWLVDRSGMKSNMLQTPQFIIP